MHESDTCLNHKQFINLTDLKKYVIFKCSFQYEPFSNTQQFSFILFSLYITESFAYLCIAILIDCSNFFFISSRNWSASALIQLEQSVYCKIVFAMQMHQIVCVHKYSAQRLDVIAYYCTLLYIFQLVWCYRAK